MAEEIIELSEKENLENRIEYLERKIKYFEHYLVTDEKILSWLANNIDTDKKTNVDEVKDMLRNQIAVSYLLIWPILEQRRFSGFLKSQIIPKASEILACYYDKDLKKDLDIIINRFFERYKDRNNLSKLRGSNSSRMINKILSKGSFADVTEEEKIRLLLFVIYRYRNNIFHGNKNIEQWMNYNDQINDCLVGMMKINDCMKRHGIVIKSENNNNGIYKVKIDIQRLRNDIKDNYDTAAFTGFPVAMMDIVKVEKLSDQEIVDYALKKNVRLEKYIIQE